MQFCERFVLRHSGITNTLGMSDQQMFCKDPPLPQKTVLDCLVSNNIRTASGIRIQVPPIVNQTAAHRDFKYISSIHTFARVASTVSLLSVRVIALSSTHLTPTYTGRWPPCGHPHRDDQPESMPPRSITRSTLNTRHVT